MNSLNNYLDQNRANYQRKHPGKTVLIYYDRESRIQMQVCKSEKEAKEYAPREFTGELRGCLIVNIPKRNSNLERKVRRKVR